MFKKLIYILIFLINWTTENSFAQGDAVISGRIFDKESGDPLPFVTVTLSENGDSLSLTGALSDKEGRFLISGVENGSFSLRFSFIGYQTITFSVIVGELNRNYDLGRVDMFTETKELSEVVIQAKQEIISAEPDKKTFSLKDNFALGSGSVLDALKGIPGVNVDQEGKVLLRGSDKVAILIDGKQSSLTGFGNQKGLGNIPVSNIESIEIINNPSAKYDASGMAGIINIQYKKEKESGMNGTAGFTFGLGQITKRKEDLPTELGSYSMNQKFIPSLNLNYRTPRMNAFLESEIFFRKHLPNNEFTTRYYDDGTITESQVPENRTQTQYILKGGVDWYLDTYNTLSFSAILDYEHHIDTAQVPYIYRNSMERYRFWSWYESEVTGFMNYRTDYKHAFEEPGHELNASVQYTRGWEDEAYYLNDSSIIRQSFDTTHIIATEHTIPVIIDYVKPLPSGRIESGIKLQFRWIPITYTIGQGDESVIYPGLGDWSKWGENIYNGYLNYVHEKKKYDIEAGVRVEYVNVYYNLDPDNIYYDQNDSYHYFRIYPNLRFTYKINDKNRVTAFYNRRVDRPGEAELRVFPKYDDPELLKVGNPYLRPQFSQTFELGYKNIWDSGSFLIAGFYRMIDDPFTRIYSIDSTNTTYNIINKIYQNVGSATNAGMELILTQNIGSFWRISSSFNWYRNKINAYHGILLFPYERPFSISATDDSTWDVKLTNLIEITPKTELQLTVIYYAPKNIPQGRQLSRSSVDLGFKRQLFEDKAELIFSFNDIFNRLGIRQQIRGDGFKAIYENYYETQTVSLGFRYKF